MKILLLQGPVGPFFKHLATELRSFGHEVSKINFNGGDYLFYQGLDVTAFRAHPSAWPGFLRRFLNERGIERIYLFGEYRLYHRSAINIAKQLELDVFVFEEGYIRPNYVTLERDGVNANSRIPRDPQFYRGQPESAPLQPRPVENVFSRAGWMATGYWVAGGLLKPLFPYYQHHRGFNFAYEAFAWVRSWARKHLNKRNDSLVLQQLIEAHSKNFFLVPLQVATDAQVHSHSDFFDKWDFIEQVVRSFSEHAPQKIHLVFKHHPMDRGYNDYTRYIDEITERYRVRERVHYVHDSHLPTLLDHALGTVVINSTVGLSSLLHNTPVKVLGRANYDMPGLTHSGTLASFWQAPSPIDAQLHAQFRQYLLTHNQINGNFYSRLRDSDTPTGLVWPKWYIEQHLNAVAAAAGPKLVASNGNNERSQGKNAA